MKTILTKILPSTNTRPYRIKALIHGEPHSDNITVTQGQLENAGVETVTGEDAHRYAAKLLADKIEWKGDFVSGYLAGDYVHLFLPTGFNRAVSSLVASEPLIPSDNMEFHHACDTLRNYLQNA